MNQALTRENFRKGFLVDEELMGGVTELEPGNYLSFVLQHTSGEYLGQQLFTDLDQALAAIAQVQRTWQFESTHACGGGKCSGSACPIGGCATGKLTEAGCDPEALTPEQVSSGQITASR
jgi:hypothetical protein